MKKNIFITKFLLFVLFYFVQTFAFEGDVVGNADDILENMHQATLIVIEKLSEINDSLSTLEIQLGQYSDISDEIEAWIKFVYQTSPNIVVVEKNGAYFAKYVATEDKKKFKKGVKKIVKDEMVQANMIQIYPGEHNLWYKTTSILCGYDAYGIFFERS